MPICEFDDCKTHACYNFKGESPIFCKTHKEEGMIDVINKKCEFDDCETQAYYNLKGERPIFCKTHKEEGMVDVINKKCEFKDCGTLACYNLKGKRPIFCKTHKENDMVNVKSKTCEFDDCDTIAYYNLKGKSPIFCKTHKENDMVNVKNKTCEFDDCETIASYNFKGELPIFCKTHKEDGMVGVKHKRCLECGLYQVTKRTNFLCWYCNPIKNKKRKLKELRIANLFEKHGFSFVNDKEFKNNCCLKFRPDFVLKFVSFYLIVEVDEGAHSQYSKECENIRMNLIMMAMNMPVKFIRYNPDLKGVSAKNKEKELLKVVEQYSQLDLLYDISPVYLFYP